MKRGIETILLCAICFAIGVFLPDGCNRYRKADNVISRDTVFTDRVTLVRDTLWMKPEPKVVTEKVFIRDTSGVVQKNIEIERLQKYCNSVSKLLAEAYSTIKGQESKMVELANLATAIEGQTVDLPVNHYEKEETSEKTGVTAKVSFDTYGYVRGDSIQLILSDTDQNTLAETSKTIDNTKRRAFGFSAGFQQELGGANQNLSLRVHRRYNWFIVGAGATSNTNNPTSPQYVEGFLGVEFGKRK